MLPQNLKVNSPIVLTKLVAPRTLAILIDKDDHALLRILDCSTQTPLKTYKKVFNNTQGSHYYVVENFMASYDVLKKELEVMELSSAKMFSHSTSRYHKDADVSALYLAENGAYCVTGDTHGKINIWTQMNLEPLYSFGDNGSAVVTLALDGENTRLLSGRADGSVLLHTLNKEQDPILLIKHKKDIKRVFFINDQLISIDLSGMLNIYDLTTHEVIESVEFKSGIKDMTMAYENSCIIVLTNDAKILLLNLDRVDKKTLEIDQTSSSINSMTFDDVSKRLMLSTDKGDLFFYDLSQDANVIAYMKVDHPDTTQERVEQKSLQTEDKKKFTFLSVDDSKSIRNVIVKAIKIGFPGTEVLEAVDGAEALNMIHEHDIDCVILDWNMPKLNGEEVLKYIRVFKKFDKIKIIMATTEAERTKVLNAIKNGADGYIVKPFNSETFFSKVAKSIMPENETNNILTE